MSSELNDKKLLDLVYTDELTRIYNRRYLNEQVPRNLSKAKKKDKPIAFFMFDMDNFKGINDNHGHQAGDDALVHFTKILSEKIAKRGTAIRYAGDEFVLLVPRLDKKAACDFVLDIQKKMVESPLKVGKTQITLGCSAGVALYPLDGKDVKILFKKADEALYAAKYQGKGRVIAFPDSGKLLIPSKLDSILEAPYIVGRDEVIKFLEKHISKKGNPLDFPVMMGADGEGKTRLIKHASELTQKKLKFALSIKGYPLWQTQPYGSLFAGLGSLFENDQPLSDHVFSILEEKYRQILKPNLYSWDVKEVKEREKSSEQETAAIIEALTRTFLILRETGDGAVLLDDIDEIDSPSLQFLDSQIGQKGPNNLFFVSSLNSTDLATGEEKLLSLLNSMPEIASQCEIKRFLLEPLGIKDIEGLEKKLFDGKTFHPETVEALLRNSDGKPLFIIETISFLLQEGKIKTDGVEWDLSSVQPEDVPLNLADLVKKRLERMDKESQHVIKLASILGEKINIRMLAEMAGLKPQEVHNIIANARRLLFVEETPNPDEFVFSHRLGRSISYSLMDEEQRRNYHALAAEIENKYARGSLERVAGRLAYHYQNAGKMAEAVKMLSTLKVQMDEMAVSKSTLKALQKRIISSATSKESVLEEEMLSKAPELAISFRTAMQNLRLYPKENMNVKMSINRLLAVLESYLAQKTEALSISLTSDVMLLNSQPVPSQLADSPWIKDLYTVLTSYGLQGVLFVRGVSYDEITRFLEIFTMHPDDVANQWDVIVDQSELTHILPDRKVFVAVGERKIFLEDKEVVTIRERKEGESAPVYTSIDSQRISDKHLEQLKGILDQFSKEKQELISAIRTSNIDEADIHKLVELLEGAKITGIEKFVPEPEGVPTFIPEAPQKDKYADVLPDMEVVKKTEEDIALLFEELNSEDISKRAKAAAWLAEQEPTKLAEAGLKAIISNMPLKTRRLAAAVVKKAGKAAVEALLRKVNHEMPVTSLVKVVMVLDTFIGNPSLIPLLREIALLGPSEVLPPAIEVMKQVPGEEIDGLFLELFQTAEGKTKLDILSLFADRKIYESVPVLLELIEPKRFWEKEERVLLQTHACRTLGMLRAAEAVDALISVASATRALSVFKSKPVSIRVAATRALRLFPPEEKIAGALNKLQKDRSPLVRRAASE